MPAIYFVMILSPHLVVFETLSLVNRYKTIITAEPNSRDQRPPDIAAISCVDVIRVAKLYDVCGHNLSPFIQVVLSMHSILLEPCQLLKYSVNNL